jgi:hypothetical protein
MSFERLLVCLCLVAQSTGLALADPGDAIGSAVTVVNQVTGEFRQDVRHLTTGDEVLQEEVIAAGADSIGELMLRDQTKLAIGPGARLTLDRALPGQPFRPLATVTVDSRGHYARTLTVANTATYRSRGVTGLVSHANKVVAQDRMTFGAVRNAFRTYTLSGKVYPARKGQLVKLSYLNGSSYTPLASVSTDQYGRWSYKHTYNFTKTYTFKAVSAATTLNASKAVTLKVAVK